MSNCSVNLFDTTLKLQSSTFALVADTIETNDSNIQYAIFAGGQFAGGAQDQINDVNVFICNDNGVFKDTRNNTTLETKTSGAAITTVRNNSGQSYALIGGGYNGAVNENRIQLLFCNDEGVFYSNNLTFSSGIRRQFLAATTINAPNNKFALFAGGETISQSNYTNIIDIVLCNDTDIISFGSTILSQFRASLVGTTIKSINSDKEYALFAGGFSVSGFSYTPYNDVDGFFANDDGVFNSNNVEPLSQARFELAGTTIQSASGKQYSLFAGGVDGDFIDYNTIDVYVANDTGVYKDTSSVSLSNAKRTLKSTTLSCADGSTLALFAGGITDFDTFNDVDIYFANDTGVYFQDNIDITPFQIGGNLAGTNLVNKAGDQAEYAIFAGGVNNNFTNFSNDVNVFLLSENNVPCFVAGSLVSTDQGDIQIENLKPGKHTISGKNIINITSSISLNVYNSDYLIVFDENSLGDGTPFARTVCSPLHKIFYENKMTEAKNIMKLRIRGVYRVPYRKERLYNVQLENYGEMIVNGMKVETLHPTNAWAKSSK